MASPEAKGTMRTCTVQMLTENSGQAFSEQPANKRNRNQKALVFIELLVIIGIFGFLIAITTLNLTGTVGRSKFEREVSGFIGALQMAVNAAAESNRRYAVIIDIMENSYTFRQFASLELDIIPDEEAIMKTTLFSKNCLVEYVAFDDGVDTRDWGDDMQELAAKFMAGHSGWQNGGKIVFLDLEGNQYSVIVNRLSRTIELKQGDVEILEPKDRKDVPF